MNSPGEPRHRAEHLVLALAQHQVQVGAENTSSSRIGRLDETNGRSAATGGGGARGIAGLRRRLVDRVGLGDELGLGGPEEHVSRVVRPP